MGCWRSWERGASFWKDNRPLRGIFYLFLLLFSIAIVQLVLAVSSVFPGLLLLVGSLVMGSQATWVHKEFSAQLTREFRFGRH